MLTSLWRRLGEGRKKILAHLPGQFSPLADIKRKKLFIQSVDLLRAESDYGIDMSGSPGGKITGDEAADREQESHAQ
jgi:hypothetical protein